MRAALDHLRNAHLRTLGRMQRHENAADGLADDDRVDGPEKAQPVNLHAQRTGHDGQRRDIAAEPQRKKVAHLAVPLLAGHGADGVLLDHWGRIVRLAAHGFVSCGWCRCARLRTRTVGCAGQKSYHWLVPTAPLRQHQCLLWGKFSEAWSE